VTLVSLRVDFRTAGLEVRERFHLPDQELPRVYDALSRIGVEEAVLTRTCNRLEAICWWPDASSGPSLRFRGHQICRAWVGSEGPEADLLHAHARVLDSTDVVRHLLRVAAGLESQILGDIHILGQLRRAYRDAVDADAVGSHLHRLFETALRVGKQVKRETHLMATRSGVGSEAARRAMDRLGPLRDRECVIVGSGKIGSQAARSLSGLGAKNLTILNRTVHRARLLADEIGATRAAGLDLLPQSVARADLVVVATNADAPVLTVEAIEAARSSAGSTASVAPLLVIDVCVPRNVQPEVGRLEGVELVDLDTLHPEAAEVEKGRNAAVPEAEARVEAGVDEFTRWLALDAARRALRPFHEALSEACRREVTHLAGESPSSERTADRIVARVLSHPMKALRLAWEQGESIDAAADVLGGFFDRREVDRAESDEPLLRLSSAPHTSRGRRPRERREATEDRVELDAAS